MVTTILVFLNLKERVFCCCKLEVIEKSNKHKLRVKDKIIRRNNKGITWKNEKKNKRTSGRTKWNKDCKVQISRVIENSTQMEIQMQNNQ